MVRPTVEHGKQNRIQWSLNRLASLASKKSESRLTADSVVRSLKEDELSVLFRLDPTLGDRLSVVTDELESKGLSALGRMVFRSNFIRALENYTGMAEAWNGRSGIANDAPWIILGFQRSGTTFLQQLLSQDPQSQGMSFWKVLNPDPRVSEWRKKLRASQATLVNRWVNPESRIIHEITPTSFEECWWLFGHQIGTLCFDFHFDLPKTKEFLAQTGERNGLYSRYAKMLSFIGEPADPRPFVLKAPDHLWRLEELFRVFPRARVVWMHRDPIESLPSFSALSSMHRRAVLDHFDPANVGPHVTRTFAEGVTSAMHFRDTHPEVNIYDLRYSDFIRDPLAAIRRIYGFFGEDIEENSRTAFTDYLERDPHRKKAPHRYETDAYGIDPGHVDELFKSYRLRFLE